MSEKRDNDRKSIDSRPSVTIPPPTLPLNDPNNGGGGRSSPSSTTTTTSGNDCTNQTLPNSIANETEFPSVTEFVETVNTKVKITLIYRDDSPLPDFELSDCNPKRGIIRNNTTASKSLQKLITEHVETSKSRQERSRRKPQTNTTIIKRKSKQPVDDNEDDEQQQQQHRQQ